MDQNQDDEQKNSSPLADLKNTFEFSEKTKSDRRHSSHAHTLDVPPSRSKPVENVGASLDFLDESEGGQDDEDDADTASRV